MGERAVALVGVVRARVLPRDAARFCVTGPSGAAAAHFANPVLAMAAALSRSMESGAVYAVNDRAARLCVAIDGALFAADGQRRIPPIEAILASGR